jgi:hypothetical protein
MVGCLLVGSGADDGDGAGSLGVVSSDYWRPEAGSRGQDILSFEGLFLS